MKICMFLDNPITNDPRVKAESSALAAAGNDVTVIGTRVADKSEYEEWEGVKFERIKVKPNKFQKLLNIIKSSPSFIKGKNKFLLTYKINMLKRQDKLYIKRVADRKFDVFHSNDVFLLKAAGVCAERCGAKLVYDSHEFFTMEYFTKKKKVSYVSEKYYEELLRRQAEYIKKADLVITTSDCFAKELQKYASLDKTPLTLYNTAKLRERIKLNVLREKYLHTSEERPIVLYQGGIGLGRGLPQFIKIAKGNPGIDFVIIGPVSNAGLYQELKNESENSENIYFLKSVPYEELWQITASADFGYSNLEPINISYEIAVGNKFFEYLSAGLPIITGNSKGSCELRNKIAEHFDDIENPMFLLPKDESQMQKSVGDFIAECDIHKLSDNAYEIAKKYFNQSIELKKVVDAYNGLIYNE